MTVSVKCPNPKCQHHKVPFDAEVPSPIATIGGTMRWKNMTEAQKKQHLARMRKARFKGKKKSK